MKSVMSHNFSQVPRANIPRSSFNRSHGVKTAFDADYLVPILVDEVVPGDTFNCNLHFFARLATPIYPLLDNLYLETFAFFIPNRLLWDNWERMHGAQDNPADSISYTVPQIATSTTVAEGDLHDYFGLPTITYNTTYTPITCLPGRAYSLVWNTWFRDENLQDSLTVTTDNGPDTVSDTDAANRIRKTLLKRGKRHDYFTSALPWPQKGDALSIVGGTYAIDEGTTGPAFTVGATADYLKGTASSSIVGKETGNWATTGTLKWSDADLSVTVGTTTINDLRLAFQTQRLLERDARSGTRYNELILSHFGVTVPDFRVQRPEFLGGGSTPISITPVANTTSVDSTNDPSGADRFTGQLSAFGTASGKHGWTKSFVEHGIVMVLANVRGDITYSQGVERFWSKETRYDFYYPVLATIGEQSVYNREIFVQGDTNDDAVFGYQERYAEMRYKPSRLTGLMSVDHSTSLSAWHLSEDFASLPSLDSTFIQSNTGGPLDRALAVPSEPHIIFDGYFDLQCARPMPLFGVPGNLDHF